MEICGRRGDCPSFLLGGPRVRADKQTFLTLALWPRAEWLCGVVSVPRDCKQTTRIEKKYEKKIAREKSTNFSALSKIKTF